MIQKILKPGQILKGNLFNEPTIREAMEQRRAPFYLRRTKEAMVYFPERDASGSWVAKRIFTKRIPHTVDFHIDGAEFELYRDVTRYVKQQSAKAAAQGDDPRARAVGFLISLFISADWLPAPMLCGWLSNMRRKRAVRFTTFMRRTLDTI